MKPIGNSCSSNAIDSSIGLKVAAHLHVAVAAASVLRSRVIAVACQNHLHFDLHFSNDESSQQDTDLRRTHAGRRRSALRPKHRNNVERVSDNEINKNHKTNDDARRVEFDAA